MSNKTEDGIREAIEFVKGNNNFLLVNSKELCEQVKVLVDFAQSHSPTQEATVEEIGKIAEDIFVEESKIDTVDVVKQVDKHGLLNPEKWDNPEAGFFDMKGYFKKLSTALSKEFEIKRRE